MAPGGGATGVAGCLKAKNILVCKAGYIRHPYGVSMGCARDFVRRLNTDLARRLKQARLHTGLSQKELGIRAGLDPHVASPRINQYERGKHEPMLEIAERLAQALGIPAAFLYTDDDLLAVVLRCSLSKAEARVGEADRGHAREVNRTSARPMGNSSLNPPFGRFWRSCSVRG